MHVVKLLSIILVDCYKYFLSSYRFICALPSVYLVNGKDIKSYLSFQILCLYFYPPFYNSTKLCNDILTNVSCRLRRRTTITTKMKYLRNNAACCIPLRPLRYLRETTLCLCTTNCHLSHKDSCTRRGD
jgi:hypothetical protein